MSWEEVIKKPKFLNRVVGEIKNNPKYEVVEVDPKRSHGGKIDYTESEEQELHEDEPHSLFPPSTPKNPHNYIRRLPTILERNASGRSKFRGQSFSLSKMSWENILKKKIKCPDCPKTFDTKEEHRQHHMKEHGKHRRSAFTQVD